MEERKGKTYPVLACDYKILEEVGQGVSATVYRATCLPFSEIVAIKSLDLEKCNSNLDEIRKEAQTMSLISNANVVQAHCSFVVGQSLWVVMPYMAGGSCLHIMKAAYPDGFEEPVIATVLKEALKALDYLHRHGHIHRDVKAGNILVDANGTVKLGDFGVSACMFDTGDRQRSRNTFVGTPCWMAPEVMEQLHGYDFKADIWSFGITALELAHGHAPFSKYPPMKVLLMTLQNAPPGLDYERDKRFSKSFKEMIAMCLVKDPTKRPSAEKLLKHSFFKHARSPEYIARHVLEGLPPLGERVKTLKDKDAARLAQKKMPYGEQEEKSQKEYKRGVSSWNFNVEDLKAQAALIQDDDESIPAPISKVPEEEDQTKSRASDDSADASPQLANSSPQPSVSRDSERCQIPLPIFMKPETNADGGDRVFRGRASSQSKANGSRSGSQPLGRKEPKHIGRFDVFEDDGDLVSPGWSDGSKPSDFRRSESVRDVRDAGESRKLEDKEKRDERDPKRVDEGDREEYRRTGSGPLVTEHVVSSARGREDERDRDRDHRLNRQGEDGRNAHHRERGYNSGPLSSSGAPVPDSRPTANGGSSRPSSSSKEGEEKLKGPVIQKKGRFSVVSDDVDIAEEVHHPSVRPKGSSQQLNQTPSFSQIPTAMSTSSATVPVSALMSNLQNIYNQGAVQQDLLLNVISSLSTGDVPSGQRLNHGSSKHFARTPSSGSSDFPVEPATERERELMQQLADLQNRYTHLLVEMHNLKLRNVQLERKLNAISNKEEEERIRREEAAKEDG